MDHGWQGIKNNHGLKADEKDFTDYYFKFGLREDSSS